MVALDHIVISVKDLKKSKDFYSIFLGKPKLSKWDVSWKLGEVRLFLALPYKRNVGKFDKANLGLNHLAFRVKDVAELNRYSDKLSKAKIKNSGIQIEQHTHKKFIWFDDLDGIRLEFYLR